MTEFKHILEVRGLKKYFASKQFLSVQKQRIVKAVDGVSFSIDNGEAFGLVGESGCGKTTCAKCILRLIEPSEGEVIFEANDILKLKGRALKSMRRNIQVVFQNPGSSLNLRKQIYDILRDPLVVHGLAREKEIRGKTAALLETVGLFPDLLRARPYELSGGQQQRVAIARALSLTPKVLVCDEPFSSLDVSIQAGIINLLKDLKAKLNLALLFISHDLAAVRYLCEKAAVMYAGRIVETAPVDVLFSNPCHPYTQVLLNAALYPSKIEPLQGDFTFSKELYDGCSFYNRCSKAKAECRTIDPLLNEVSTAHYVRCLM